MGMRVCYCEDEIAQARLLKSQIEAWGIGHNIKINMDIFESAEEFLFKAQPLDFDLIFLDISMKNMNGMELAKRIRENDKKAVIVFITSDPSYVFEGYEVGAFRYLIKPIEGGKLEEILESVCAKADEKKEECIIVKIGGESHRLEIGNIAYLESQGHYINIVKSDGETLSLKSSFSDILKRINANGQYCVVAHRSYAVNVSQITSIGRNECKLSNGDIIPVSRSAYKELNDAFIKYNLEGM